MAIELATVSGGVLAAQSVALLVAVAVDLAVGDPTYRWHPIRLMGHSLTGVEALLRRAGADGYGGGVALFLVLATLWCGGTALMLVALASRVLWIAWALHVFIVYSMLALGDLLVHVWRVERAVAAGDLPGARAAIAWLVGRDTDRMDGAACRRAAIESLSESLTDGFVSPLFWYALGGVPALVLFKVVSTMDSMVGYKTPRYLRFGWCGARLDDVMNFVPARLTWLLIAAVAAVVPGCSPRRALVVGWRQHAVLPGPNSGWSEAAAAGAIARRIVGPMWRGGVLVTDIWIGDPNDPPASTREDVIRATVVVTASGIVAVAIVVATLAVVARGLSVLPF